MIKRGGPEQCCGTAKSEFAIRSPTERQRMTGAEKELLLLATADRACDHVWGVWRPVRPKRSVQAKHPALREAMGVCGVPEVSGKDQSGWVLDALEVANIIPMDGIQ